MLDFNGKSEIYAHHQTVPIRPLVQNKSKSLTPKDDDNLIIHGDNLHALKALLPRYAGRVNCIYIDPPYNTGNEKWAYNDNVNSPMMKEWLKCAEDVDGEDLERHDKWMCMMWPRLKLLKELLSDDGAIFVSIDDHEQHRLRMMMDEIFGTENFVTNIIWEKKFSPQNDAKYFSDTHDFIVTYAKNKNVWKPRRLPRTKAQEESYSNPDNDVRGPWVSGGMDVKTYQKEYDYPITTPAGRIVHPPKGSCWRYSKEKFENMIKDNKILFGKEGKNVPRVKRFLSEVREGVPPMTIWLYENRKGKKIGHTQGATQALKQMNITFDNSKPHTLIEEVLRIGTNTESIVLDSFAGSGTTAHAVLSLNKQDGGNRKFILVECENYADTVTAERVRRVIRGIPTSKNFKEPLGGSFTYCTLGKPLDVNKILTGKTLPDYSTLASHLLYNAKNISVNKKLKSKNKDGLFYSTDDTDYYLLYKPDLKYMQSDKLLLNGEQAKRIHKIGKNAVIFGPGKHMGQRDLIPMNISFCLIPYNISRGG